MAMRCERATEDRILAELAAKGATCRKAADALGITPAAARARARRLGVAFAPAKMGHPTQWAPEQDARMRELAASGATRAEAAEALGVTVAALAGRAHRAGVSFRGRGAL